MPISELSWGQIGQRAGYQHLAIAGSVISTGTLLGMISSAPAGLTALLLVIPWVLGVAGIVWLDHAHGIHAVASYIRDEIESKKLPEFLDTDKGATIGWETFLTTERRASLLLESVLIILPLIYFVLPTLASFSAYFLLRRGDVTELPVVLEWSFVGLGGALSIAVVFSWVRAIGAYQTSRR